MENARKGEVGTKEIALGRPAQVTELRYVDQQDLKLILQTNFQDDCHGSRRKEAGRFRPLESSRRQVYNAASMSFVH